MAVFAALLCLPFAALAAGNTTVYRCGQTYQQSPCPAGQAVNVADEREAGQQAQAKKAQASDKALAKDLAAERREREKSVKPQAHAAGIPVSPGLATKSDTKPADPCKTKSGRPSKAKKIKCVDGSPLYAAPADAVGKSSTR
jgi:hypothetical protein